MSASSSLTLPKQYPPLLLLHTLLLPASLFLLPQTSLVITLPAPERGLDKPQHPLLDPLTARPIVTVAWSVVGAAALVGWWAGWVREWVREGRMGGAGVETRLSRIGDKKATDVWNAWIFTLYASFAIHAVLVLFGAPITTHLMHTYLLSLLLSILTTFVPAYALGPPSLPLPLLSRNAGYAPDSSAGLIQNNTWIRLFAEFAPRTPSERALVYPAIGAFMGAWTGAIPIGLDWDRPWQAWPLTPAYSAVIGYVLGAIGALGTSGVLILAHMDTKSSAIDGKDTTKKAVAKKVKKGGKVKAA
ncbi:hypothetical protein EW146_g2923 [Bondarzewia mesenterica]|uniref:Uncharacterized protein n=1 Tax=Bondarzewia mesenterica TaxID=1095465 RepID=A0A4S4M0Q3_9AGAM|nr:hypothetical protein EW146_g2923 [Bondarzewia mesenterica]